MNDLTQERVTALLATLAQEHGTTSDRQLARAISAHYGIRATGMTIFRWRRGIYGTSLIQLMVARQDPQMPIVPADPVLPGNRKNSDRTIMRIREDLTFGHLGTVIALRHGVSTSLVSRIKNGSRHRL